MQGYSSKKELINEINKRAKLFIDEFKEIKDENKDTFVKEVDRSPAQMIALLRKITKGLIWWALSIIL